jgi:hypothetical protein
MSVIVTRAGKGSALTWLEADANFSNLNNGKAEASNSTLNGTASIEGLKMAQRTVTAATYTAVVTDYTILCDTTSNSITISLPTAVGNKGLTYEIKKTVAANTLTIDPNGAQTIDGSATIAITAQHEALVVRSDGANWVRTSSFVTAGGGGTVTSVAMSGGTTGMTFTGGPITGAGTFTAGGTLITANGGTGFASYAVGDLLQASTTSALAKLAAVATGNVLLSGGVGVVSSWGKVALTTHVSGTLPVANGGTGVTASTGTGSVVLSASPTLTGEVTVGGLSTAISAKTANYTATVSDHTLYFDTTAAGYTLTLPAASGNAGLEYVVKKTVAANTLTIDANASETIDGALTLVMSSQYDAVQIKCDGAGWQVLARGATVPGGSGTVTSVAMSGGTTGMTFTGGPITGAGTFTAGGTLITANGGTGFASYAVGDLLQASTTSALAKLAAVATGNVLLSGGVGVVSSWGKVALTTHVSGTLPVANGGTGVTASTGTGSVVLSAAPVLTGKTTVGGLVTAASTKTANYTLTTSDHYIMADATSGNLTLTLPAASGNAGLQYYITKTTAANQVIIDPNAAETINGSSTFILYAIHDGLIIECDGVGWRIVSANIANPNYSIIGCSSYIQGGHIYAGGGARVGWATTGYLGNNSDGDFNLTNNAGNVGRLRVGGVSSDVVTKTAAYTTTTFDETVLCDTTTAFTLTLHTAVGNKGQRIEVIKTVAANTLTIATTSSQTINGGAASAQNLTSQWSRFTVKSDGANWVRVD